MYTTKNDRNKLSKILGENSAAFIRTVEITGRIVNNYNERCISIRQFDILISELVDNARTDSYAGRIEGIITLCAVFYVLIKFRTNLNISFQGVNCLSILLNTKNYWVSCNHLFALVKFIIDRNDFVDNKCAFYHNATELIKTLNVSK